ncbi:MAG: hypothetical protein ACOYW9_03570 [Deinococcota bacterium]|nr:hypothetical protein [Allomeiothermus silvanus]
MRRPVAELYLPVSASGQGRNLVRVGESVSVDLEFGPEFLMHVFFAAPEEGEYRVRLVGGTGGLSRTIPAKTYENVRASRVALEILAEVGEGAGEISLSEPLRRWVRGAGPAYQALEALVLALDHTWRMLPGGEVWIGKEQWPRYDRVVKAARASHQSGHYTFPLEPELLPGTVLMGQYRGMEGVLGRVEQVIHRIGKEPCTEVFCS